MSTQTEKSLNPGDVVILNSGGPRMTVTGLRASSSGSTGATCQWFDDNTLRDGYFAVASLKKVSE